MTIKKGLRRYWTTEVWNGITVLADLNDMIEGKPMTKQNTKPAPFTSVGGYPLAYTDDCDILCPDCMWHDENKDGSFVGFINYECEHLYCDECGWHIQCAYPSEVEAGRD